MTMYFFWVIFLVLTGSKTSASHWAEYNHFTLYIFNLAWDQDKIYLVRALWLVTLAGRTLLYGPLKFKVDSVVQNCFVIYRQLFLTFIASKNLKHFLYSNN